MNRPARAFGVLAMFLLLATGSRADADVVPQTLLFSLLASTPQLEEKTPPQPGFGTHYYDVKGTAAGGFVSTDANDYGYLRDGKDLLIVPLVSGGSGGVFTTLLFTSIRHDPKFVGIVPSPAGHLEVSISEGQIDVSTPNYDNGAPNCCPSSRTETIYALDGLKLKKLRAYTIKYAR